MDAEEAKIREELLILEAMTQALERRREVFDEIEDSENMDEARHRIAVLLGANENSAQAVLDMQARRFTREQRRVLASATAERKSRLRDRR